MDVILKAAELDWAEVDPSIFGTLFEREMDPAKRSQLGAHYTSRADIETLIEPVVMAPLRREWEQAQADAESMLAKGKTGRDAEEKTVPKGKRQAEAQRIVRRFHERLYETRVLDPACGSGNFLYVALQKLKDLEKEVVLYRHDKLGEEAVLRFVGPQNNLAGIEKSEYAFDLAQLTVWIGDLQWTKKNGFGLDRSPVLSPLPNFRNMDAILDLSDPVHPKEPDWPDAEFIVGNPPFLGGKLLRSNLGDEYVGSMFRTWAERVEPQADLCCYSPPTAGPPTCPTTISSPGCSRSTSTAPPASDGEPFGEPGASATGVRPAQGSAAVR